MLHWALLFFVVAIVAGLLGLRGVVGLSAEIGYLFVMLAVVILLFALVSGALAAPAYAEGLQDQVDQAATVVERFRDLPESGIPAAIFRDARGFAILTSVKAGFIFSGQAGRGVVVARTSHGWSGPSAIATGGAGFGPQAGVQVRELVVVLNTPEAVRAFARGGNVAIGADLSAAAGPVGRDVGAGVMPVAAVYTYSRSQGLFAGASLEGTVVVTRDGANAQYYGRGVTPEAILSGEVTPPAGAARLARALDGRPRAARAATAADPGLVARRTTDPRAATLR
jgi:SH3 domain-containing YSC84-like protein 1